MNADESLKKEMCQQIDNSKYENAQVLDQNQIRNQ